MMQIRTVSDLSNKFTEIEKLFKAAIRYTRQRMDMDPWLC